VHCGKTHSILILENEFAMGGLEKKLVDFVSRIDRSHFRVVVCCLKKGGLFKADFARLGTPFYEDLLGFKYDVFAFRRLTRILEKENIELIYTLPHPNTVMFSSLAKSLGRVKTVVVSFHGSGGPTGGRLLRRYQKPFLRNADRYIAVAHSHKRYLMEVEGLDGDRMVVIHNGVDIARYHPGHSNDALKSELGINSGERVVTTVASLNAYKGIDVLLKAAKGIIEEIKDVRFLIAGAGPEKDNLLRLATHLGVADKVTFAGVRRDIDDILRLSDLFVLPSRPGPETFPNVVLEAMASGLPVVATDVGSVAELVNEAATGYLVPHDDAAALQQRIRDMLIDLNKAASFGARGRAVVEKNFPLEGMCRKREELFSSLLCRHD
jgi:glycosyltransferase involved in cell wall biosynthesis